MRDRIWSRFRSQAFCWKRPSPKDFRSPRKRSNCRQSTWEKDLYYNIGEKEKAKKAVSALISSDSSISSTSLFFSFLRFCTQFFNKFLLFVYPTIRFQSAQIPPSPATSQCVARPALLRHVKEYSGRLSRTHTKRALAGRLKLFVRGLFSHSTTAHIENKCGISHTHGHAVCTGNERRTGWAANQRAGRGQAQKGQDSFAISHRFAILQKNV